MLHSLIESLNGVLNIHSIFKRLQSLVELKRVGSVYFILLLYYKRARCDKGVSALKPF